MELFANTGPMLLTNGRHQQAGFSTVSVVATLPAVRATVEASALPAPSLDATQAALLLVDPPRYKEPGELLVVPIDFADDLLPGESIVRVEVVRVERVRMTRRGVEAVVQGDAEAIGPAQVLGGAIFQYVRGGNAGTNYLVAAAVSTSEGRRLQGEWVVRVRDVVQRTQTRG